LAVPHRPNDKETPDESSRRKIYSSFSERISEKGELAKRERKGSGSGLVPKGGRGRATFGSKHAMTCRESRSSPGTNGRTTNSHGILEH